MNSWGEEMLQDTVVDIKHLMVTDVMAIRWVSIFGRLPLDKINSFGSFPLSNGMGFEFVLNRF
jgi:hypothetical protein